MFAQTFGSDDIESRAQMDKKDLNEKGIKNVDDKRRQESTFDRAPTRRWRHRP